MIERGRAVFGAIAVLAILATVAVAWVLLGVNGSVAPYRAEPRSRPPAFDPGEGDRAVRPPDPAVFPGPALPGAPPPAPTHGPEVIGLVLLATGEPAEGATVTLRADTDEEEGAPEGGDPARATPDEPDLTDLFGSGSPAAPAPFPRRDRAPSPHPGEGPAPVESTTSGAGGRFAFRAPGRGPFRVEAFRDGAGRTVREGVLADGPPLILRLGSSLSLRGIALDGGGGAPLPGARIEARARDAVRTAVAAEDGTFTLADLPAGSCDLLGRAEDRAVVLLEEVPVAPDRAPVQVVFREGFALRVTVHRGEDRPLRPGRTPPPPGPPMEGARVTAYHRKSGSVVSAVTGAAGVARLGNLAPGTWKVVAQAEGHGLGLRRTVTFEEGDPLEKALELRLAPLVPKVVRVLDAGGAPVPGARAFWAGEFGALDLERSEPAGTTDARGEVRVAFDERIDRKSVLWIVPSDGAAFLLDPEDPGSDAEEKVVVGPGRVVKGTVTDGKGNPVPGATIHLEVEDERGAAGLLFEARTDPSGTYAFPRVPFGKLLATVETEFDFTDAEREAEVRDDPLVLDFRMDDPWVE